MQDVSSWPKAFGEVSAFLAHTNLSDVLWASEGDLRPAYVTPNVEQLLGYSADEVVAGNPEHLLTPTSLETVKTAFDLSPGFGMGETGAGVLLEPVRLQLQVKRKDRSTVWTVSDIVALGVPGETRLAGVVGISREIRHYDRVATDDDAMVRQGAALGYLLGLQAASGRIVEMEEKLRNSTTLYERLLDRLPYPAMLIREDSRVLAANRSARDPGARLDELCRHAFGGGGGDDESAYSPGEGSRPRPASQAAATGQPVNEEVTALGRSWDAWWVPLEDGVTLQYAVDITDRKEVEQRLKGMREQEGERDSDANAEFNRRIDFVRALVHELKTPLTSVIASGELLAAELSEGPLLRLTRNLNRGAHNLNNRIDELLDLAKGELGMLKLKLRSVDMVRLLREVVADMDPAASTNGQTLVLRVPVSMPYVLADEERLRRVMLNLINNACKWTPNGESIVISAWKQDGSILVTVQGHGPGVGWEELQRVFEPYYRAEQDRQYASGLGLGLALCKILVELHGGRIWAESRTGEGNTFSFSLPLTARSTAQGREAGDG